MMNDCEEVLDGFPPETKEKPAESMIEAYCAESTGQNTAESGTTAKIPPLFDGSTSWFKYEELIDDWLDHAMLEAEKRVNYFRDTLRPHFIKRAQSVFLWRFYQFTGARRGHIEIVKFNGFLVGHVADVRTERKAKNKPVSCCRKTDKKRDGFGSECTSNPRKVECCTSNDESLFSFNDNLTTLMFIVASDLMLRERETHKFPVMDIPLTQKKVVQQRSFRVPSKSSAAPCTIQTA